MFALMLLVALAALFGDLVSPALVDLHAYEAVVSSRPEFAYKRYSHNKKKNVREKLSLLLLPRAKQCILFWHLCSFTDQVHNLPFVYICWFAKT